jgi:hypothetical protein
VLSDLFVFDLVLLVLASSDEFVSGLRNIFYFGCQLLRNDV